MIRKVTSSQVLPCFRDLNVPSFAIIYAKIIQYYILRMHQKPPEHIFFFLYKILNLVETQ